jgi:hypothetical protein
MFLVMVSYYITLVENKRLKVWARRNTCRQRSFVTLTSAIAGRIASYFYVSADNHAKNATILESISIESGEQCLHGDQCKLNKAGARVNSREQFFRFASNMIF